MTALQPKDVAEQTEDGATILLVDDNPQNLKVLYETLKDRGYHLLIANDGEKALSLAERHQPELILLDIMMPGMDGFTVCEHLKANSATYLSAVVFLSALDDLDAKVKGFSVGGVDYIAKPFQAQEVIARVETHVRVIQLERALKARNQQLEGDQARILNAISEGIYGLDRDGRIIFANPAAAAMHGTTVSSLIDRNFFELHFPGESAESPGPIGTRRKRPGTTPARTTCEHGQSEHQRGVLMCRPDGSSFCMEYRSSPKLEGEELKGAVVVFRDITAEQAAEAELEDARKTVQLQREQLAHVSRLSTMGEMTAGFAHEVNQPLTAISNYARLAIRLSEAEQMDTADLHQTLEKIEAQSHRASEIIRRIRGFVKKPASGRDTVPVYDLLTDTCEFAEVDAHTNDTKLLLSVPPDLPDVCIDTVQVQQVALNLIRNALEATRAKGSHEPVEVLAKPGAEDKVMVEVLDRGCGLPADAEERLFHPFFTTKEEGMGIGLALCQSLVQGQGGSIGFERRSGGGTRFWFTLPAARASTA